MATITGNTSRIVRIVTAFAMFGLGFFLATKMTQCRNKYNGITVLERDLKTKVTTIEAERDSLNTLLDRWIGYYNTAKNAPPQYIYKKGESVIIRDTIITPTQTLHDTITQTDIVVLVEKDTQNALKLPHYFTLHDTHLRISGHIDAKGVYADSIAVFNSILLSNKVNNTFKTQRHTLSIAQTNPYISQMTHTFQYEKPTKRAIFVQKAASFAVGAVLGFGVGYLQK